VKKKQAIIESATRLFGTTGFDATTTLEIAAEADVTESQTYYHLKGKNELFTLNLELAFKEYYSCLDELAKQTLTEFQKLPVSATANMLIALLNGFVRQRVY
jgi:AcrR family transcriptional regulator